MVPKAVNIVAFIEVEVTVIYSTWASPTEMERSGITVRVHGIVRLSYTSGYLCSIPDPIA
jgi:hypothetical protein